MLVLSCSLEGLPPTVVYSNPANGSGNVPVTAAITAVFSASMDPSTITAATFTLTQTGIPITGTVTCAGKTVTFTPSANLPIGALLIATVTTGAKDINGVAVASDQVWSFMTFTAPSTAVVPQYYTFTFNGNPFSRSASPVTLTAGANVVSQSANPDGSVTITISNAAGYEDNGFYLYVGALKYLSTVSVTGTGPFSANLYLDVDNDGEFFSWSSDVYQAGGSVDGFYAGPAAAAGVLTLNAATVFTCIFVNNAPGANHTIPELAGGAVTGVNGNTRAAIWIGISTGAGSQTATISSLKVN